MIHQNPNQGLSLSRKKRKIIQVSRATSHSQLTPFPNSHHLFQTKVLRPSQETMMPAHGVTFSLIFLLFLATVLTTTEARLTHANGSAAVAAAATDKKDKVEPLVPLVGAENFKTLVMNETRRRLGSFQICALCTCCGGAKGLCLLLVAMPSIATFPTGPLASVRSLPRPVIVLDAISNSFSLYFIIYSLYIVLFGAILILLGVWVKKEYLF